MHENDAKLELIAQQLGVRNKPTNCKSLSRTVVKARF